jgi:myosin heavy subunit
LKKKTALRIAKGPTVITVALLTLYPICLAEMASASTPTSYETTTSALRQSRTALQTLPQSRLQTNLSSQLPTSQLPSLVSLQSTLQEYRTQLQQLRPQVKDISRIEPLIQLIDQLEALLTKATDLQTQYATQLQTFQDAQEAYTHAQTKTQEATTSYEDAKASRTAAQTSYDNAIEELNTATQTLTAKSDALQAAKTASQTTQDSYDAALLAFNEATSKLTAAQDAYDTNLIADPTFIPLTEQVPHTRQVEQTRQTPVTTIVPHTTYTTSGGILAEVFNRQGYNNAPPLPSANETPISTQIVDNINFQWGSGTILNSNRSEDVIVRFTGNLLFPTDGYYQFYTPADDGTKLTIAGMDLINDWRDKGGGGSASQQIFIRGGVLYPFTLYFYENGGGASVSFQYYSLDTPYWQVVPTNYLGTQTQATTTYEEVTTYITETYYTEETYYTTEVIPNQTAPLINDPDLLPAISQAQSNLDEAQATLDEATTAKETATRNLTTATENKSEAQSSYDDAAAKVLTETSKLTDASSAQTSAKTTLDEATSNESVQAASVDTARTTLDTTETNYLETRTQATAKSEKVRTTFQNTEPDPIPEEPKPEPPLQEKELPENLSVENLQSIDLTQIDPTTITEEQVAQLQEAAYQTFETAVEGSPEYEQALDALYLAAEADDIVLDPALAAIPGLAAATELVNFLGNAGADMSPKVREASKKVVVATVAAVGAAVASATSAASQSTTSTRKSGK